MSGAMFLVVVILAQMLCACLVIVILFLISDAVLLKEALAGICEERESLRNHLETVTVITARAMTSEKRSRLIKVFCDQTGMDPARIEFQRNPRLWAGLVIKAGERVLDFSLRGRLQRALNER